MNSWAVLGIVLQYYSSVFVGVPNESIAHDNYCFLQGRQTNSTRAICFLLKVIITLTNKIVLLQKRHLRILKTSRKNVA